jgi:hypothetical protein
VGRRSVGDGLAMRNIYWHKSVNRPVGDADIGKFIVGRSTSQWFAGYVVAHAMHGGPFVDIGYATGPSEARYWPASALRVYAFLERGPHPSMDDVLQDRPGKVVQFR